MSTMIKLMDRDFCLDALERGMADLVACLTRMLTDVRAAKQSGDVTIAQLAESWINSVLPTIDAPRRQNRGWARSLLFWFFASFHIALIVAYVTYPFVSIRYDTWFFAFTAVCVAHWFLLAGECWVGYVEKQLTYDGYRLGSAPCRTWLFDVLPTRVAVPLLCAMGFAVLVSFWVVFMRNAVPRVVTLFSSQSSRG